MSAPFDSTGAVLALHDAGRLPIGLSPFLETEPPPLPDPLDFRRIEGMMLGLAIGDALGNPSEGKPPSHRKRSVGEVTSYIKHPYHRDLRGYPSDDSQMAFWTLEQALEDGGLVPERLMRIFATRQVFGIGETVRGAVQAFHRGRPALECGGNSAGNGALMRIAPVLIPHLRHPSKALWADAILATVMTHRDSAAVASSLAFVELLWRCLGRAEPPSADDWWKPFCARVAECEGAARYRPRPPALHGREYTLSEFVYEQLPIALDAGWSIERASEHWWSAAFLLETVPTALLILARYGHDPEQAIIRAVNDTWDNDTIGAIVGAAVGALHGVDALPRRWIDGLSGRTREQDDGRMFRLIASARAALVC